MYMILWDIMGYILELVYYDGMCDITKWYIYI